jgi:hypothetical protein
MKSFDLLSVRLIEKWRRPDRMHGPDGSERKTDEDPQHVVVRVSDGKISPAIDRNQQHEGRGDAFGHGVLLGSCFVGGSPALALVQSQKGQAELDVRTLGNAPRQIAHGRLLALANRRDVFLSEVAGLEVRYE